MAHLRLRTQLLVANLVLISLLTGALLLVLRRAVRSEIADQLVDKTNASLRAFESVQRQREVELSRTTAILAELPTLKALMTTAHAPTIQDASEPFWKLAGSDLFLLASPDGKVLGFHVRHPGWSAQTAESDLHASLGQAQDSSWWYANGQVYWVFMRPIVAGTDADERQLGVLAVGYQVDSSVAEQLALMSGSQIALTTNDRVVASTLSARDESQIQSALAQSNSAQSISATSSAGKPFSDELSSSKLFSDELFSGDQYEVASAVVAPITMSTGRPNLIRCYVLVSLQERLHP